MSALVQRGSAQGRPMALAVTIALHVALVAGLLAIRVVETVKNHATPIQMMNIVEKKKPIPVETPIVPKLAGPAAVPQPVLDLPDFREAESIAAIAVDIPQDLVVEKPRGVDSGSAAVADTPLRYQAVRPSDDYYPPQAIRMAAEGAAIVRACVDAGGRLSGVPTVVRTSRVSLLDAAAVKWASEALHFQPATQAGVAVAACKEFRVSFTLH
jgi:TonB family protein